MRIAVLSDIHANLPALEAVLDHAARGGTVDALWCLGDTVGYGPQPNECIARLREFPHLAVAGNHDHAAIGRLGTEEFNPYAAEAARWTARHLSAKSRSYLEGLPLTAREGPFTLVHGSLRDPIWEYLFSVEAALAHLKLQATPYSFVGHTHIPLVLEERGDAEGGVGVRQPQDTQRLELGAQRLILNPGGVGQPRDGDPRAAYALLEMDGDQPLVGFRRVAYDVGATQRLMQQAGLPAVLWQRLAHGR